jgi:hypothetical protein
VAFIVNTFDEVEVYLRNLTDLSEAARQRLVEAYLHDLAEHADVFVERSRLEPGSQLFQYDYVLKDGDHFYHFRFIVDATSMPFGIVQVIYVDYEKSPVH